MLRPHLAHSTIYEQVGLLNNEQTFDIPDFAPLPPDDEEEVNQQHEEVVPSPEKEVENPWPELHTMLDTFPIW